jgi:hypothetical protein
MMLSNLKAQRIQLEHLDCKRSVPGLSYTVRVIITVLLGLIAAGCCSRSRQVSVPLGPATSVEAQSIASVYIIATRGACGTSARGVTDGGKFWRVQTVFGLGESSGPELRIDKITRQVTVVQEATKVHQSIPP